MTKIARRACLVYYIRLICVDSCSPKLLSVFICGLQVIAIVETALVLALASASRLPTLPRSPLSSFPRSHEKPCAFYAPFRGLGGFLCYKN